MARWIRFQDEGAVVWGRVEEGDPAGGRLRVTRWSGAPWASSAGPKGDVVEIDASALRAPAEPGKIVGVGRNYGLHAKELGNEVPAEPLIFLKPPTALAGPGASIVMPVEQGEVHHEAELGLVIGRGVYGPIAAAEARGAIFGLTCVNDVTARTIQRAEKQFTRAKGFDTFCPVGPWLVSDLDPEADRAVRCRLDGTIRQDGRTSEMAFSPVEIVRFVAQVMTLLPGDLIATGTPAGVGPMAPGQTVSVEVEGVGRLTSPIEARGW
jgi:2-keto-4-pentenoate hydratase/2-oxohepta-3-ene-1,7-dioic acid hydratase in catechol pathway